MKKAILFVLAVAGCYCSNAQVVDVVIEEVMIFEEELAGSIDVIPAGSTTYKIYLETTNSSDVVQMVYGIQGNDLEINTTTTFHISSLGATMSLMNHELFTSIAPEVAYRSYVTLANEGPVHQYNETMIGGAPTPWHEDFSNGSNIHVSDPVGGGWFIDPNYAFEDLGAGEDHLYLIGQFTTTGDLSGVLNTQTFIEGDPMNHVHNTNLLFGMENIAVFGCNDPDAQNFDSNAEYSDGSCTYLGDLNGDGVVDTADVLNFLGAFGCQVDCGDADFNGDGTVNAADLLMMLALL